MIWIILALQDQELGDFMWEYGLIYWGYAQLVDFLFLGFRKYLLVLPVAG